MSQSGITTFTHEQLIELIVESEYRSNIGFFSQPHQSWPDEALARRFYDDVYGCGLDGCQATTDDELYLFLSTYQAPRNYTLDTAQDQINYIRNQANSGSGYYQHEVDYLDTAVSRILNPPSNDNWSSGVLADQPYGWATHLEVPEAQAANVRDAVSHCNPEGFAYIIPIATDQTRRNVFFGTTIETDGDDETLPSGATVACRWHDYNP